MYHPHADENAPAAGGAERDAARRRRARAIRPVARQGGAAHGAARGRGRRPGADQRQPRAGYAASARGRAIPAADRRRAHVPAEHDRAARPRLDAGVVARGGEGRDGSPPRSRDRASRGAADGQWRDLRLRADADGAGGSEARGHDRRWGCCWRRCRWGCGRRVRGCASARARTASGCFGVPRPVCIGALLACVGSGARRAAFGRGHPLRAERLDRPASRPANLRTPPSADARALTRGLPSRDADALPTLLRSRHVREPVRVNAGRTAHPHWGGAVRRRLGWALSRRAPSCPREIARPRAFQEEEVRA